MTLPLEHCRALVTRPYTQAHALAEHIVAAGGQVIVFPSLVIEPLPTNPEWLQALQGLEDLDGVIFISRNAVEHSMPAFLHAWLKCTLPLSIMAMGPATAEALTYYGIKPDICPLEQNTTEGLLAHPELQNIKDKRYIIVAGQDGRELLQDTLSERGAQVAKFSLYRRSCPEIEADVMADTTKQWLSQVDVVISTSCASLDNLFKLVTPSQQQWLMQIPLLVISQRMVDYLAETYSKTKHVILAENASDKAIVAALAEFQQGSNHGTDAGLIASN